MEIELKEFTGMSEYFIEKSDSEGAHARFSVAQFLIDETFRDMAIHDTANIDAFVLRMLEAKIAEVKTRHPSLGDTDAYIVAGRLLKQLIACYQSALSQLLP